MTLHLCLCMYVVVVVVAAAAASVVVEAVEGGRRGSVATVVEAHGPLEDCSAAAAAASDVGVISTRCNMNERARAR